MHRARDVADRQIDDAKLVLVGDSGVGKTGLGWRLAHREFKEHESTHGQQFWVIDELKTTRTDNTECEAVLWDLAGQHVYRQIHSIFLDNVDNIQASWVTQGPKIAQLSLFFGANDFGSTMIEENVVAAAGVHFRLSEQEIKRLVSGAGFEPQQRLMDYTLVR